MSLTDATVGGVFSAGAYAGNIEQARINAEAKRVAALRAQNEAILAEKRRRHEAQLAREAEQERKEQQQSLANWKQVDMAATSAAVAAQSTKRPTVRARRASDGSPEDTKCKFLDFRCYWKKLFGGEEEQPVLTATPTLPPPIITITTMTPLPTITPTPTATPLPPLPTAVFLPPPENDYFVPAPDLKNAALQALLRHTNELPPAISGRTLIAMASAESGDKYEWNQEELNLKGTFGSSGILQIEKDKFKFEYGAPRPYNGYNNSATGFDNNVRDAVAILNFIPDNVTNGIAGVPEIETAFTSLPNGNGDTARLLVYYNAGEYYPLATYRAGSGNPNYLADVAQYLKNSQFRADYNDPLLAEDLYAAQEELNVLIGPIQTPTPSP